MTDVPRAEAGWSWFLRWGPYALLGLGAVAAAATAPVLMSATEVYLAAALAAGALCWQLAWGSRLSRALPDRTAGRVVYFAMRSALAFALCWLNPFFSIFALMGYFDAGRHLPRSRRRWGLLGIAMTLALSQSCVPDGPPPRNVVELVVFSVLFALHATLALVLDRFNDQEAEKAAKQDAVIEDLEIANARLAQALDENAALQAQLVVQAREAGITAERRRLAADLHDSMVQGLVGVVTQLQAALDSDGPASRAHTERAVALAIYSLGEARRSVHDLIPGPLENRTLPEALEQAVERWSAGSTARLNLTVVGTVEQLHDELESTLLRITEEALSNVAKHANAGRVGVTLSYIDDEVTLDVRDDGCGFDPSRAPRPSEEGGFGLDGMQVRAGRVGGVVVIESEPGSGTAISARVPLVRR
ncbi:sensor histidine kinase [Nocardia sp. CDC159]|uniref:Sensor histidine kinase n=1 Tax=Nocardia pulmonis TaxID=2951408 RepID=A0A9X2EDT1_9NOCA|nr:MULTISPECIES: sensor histidine kinase [Nocardia]MCM6779082.1 sensor histidine kinase [Nocardia pulmonis]MCM6791972.1 sensor histidine kinase [Nocardia sp. CDC159]